MDAASSLIQALIDRKDQLGLNVRSMQWPRVYDFHEFDIQVEATIGNETYIGRGTHASEDTALLIAAVELIERLTVQRARVPTSNGVAAHLHESEAEQNALRELVERDRLLNHLHAEEPFFEIPQDLSVDLQRPRRILSERGISTEIWGLRGVGEFQVRACLAFGEKARFPFGMMIGLGVAPGASTASEKAFRECLRHAVVADEHDQLPLSESEFRNLNFWSPEEHHRLALDFDYARKFRQTFCRPGTPPRSEPLTKEISFSTLPTPGWVDGLVHVRRAQSPEMQDLYFGPAKEKDVNPKALSTFTGQPDIRIDPWLHPLS